MKIDSYVGVDSIKLGMKIADVRKIMDEDPDTSFNKAEMCTDGYLKNSFQVFYKEPGICEAIEAYTPTDITFKDKKLLSEPFNKIRQWLEQEDDAIDIDNAGLTSYKLGIGLYAPAHMENPDCPIESVIVFEKGYYD
jgi:hypothetical protein